MAVTWGCFVVGGDFARREKKRGTSKREKERDMFKPVKRKEGTGKKGKHHTNNDTSLCKGNKK